MDRGEAMLDLSADEAVRGERACLNAGLLDLFVIERDEEDAPGEARLSEFCREA